MFFDFEGKDRRKVIIGLNLGLVLFYFLYFFVICQSSYSADDLFNANAKAMDYFEGNSVWKLTVGQWKLWIENGRFFPFSNYVYLLFAALPNRICYKALILISVYINSVLMSKCVSKISGSYMAGCMAMLLFPFSMQLTGRSDGALYCFHMLVQIVMLGCELSLLAVFRYIDSVREGKKYAAVWLVLSAAAYIVPLGTYEVAYIMAAFLGLGTWCYTGSIKKTLKVLTPDIVVYIFMLVMNGVVRVCFATGDTYDGTSINLSFVPVVTTFLKQIYSTFPLSAFVADRVRGIEWSKREYLGALRLRDIIMVVLFILISLAVIKFQEKEGIKRKAITFTFCMGLAVMVFPATLIALTSKYQEELVWGDGQLCNYVQSFGLMLILLSVYMIVMAKGTAAIKKCAIAVYMIITVPLMMLLQMEARVDADYKYNVYGYCRDTAVLAARNGIFDDVETGDVVFGTSDYIFDLVETVNFYSYAAEREIDAVSVGEIIPVLSEKIGQADVYSLTGMEDKYYAAYTYADAYGGYMIVGRVENVYGDGDGYSDMKMTDIKVFVNGTAYIDTTGWDVLSESGAGNVYYYSGECKLSEFK